jgi:hypothetical protein
MKNLISLSVFFEEGVMIWLLPAYLLKNPSVNLPANSLLSKDQIYENIANPPLGHPVLNASLVLNWDNNNISKVKKNKTFFANRILVYSEEGN